MKKALAIVLGLAVFYLVLLHAILPALNHPKTTAQSKSNTVLAQHYLNTPARDGKIEFVVTKVDCGVAKVGDLLATKANGQFCLLDFTAKNIGSEPSDVPTAGQSVFANGNKYVASTSASLYATSSTGTFDTDINPGLSVSGTLAFDMPIGVTPASAVLHDDPLSGGVKIILANQPQ